MKTDASAKKNICPICNSSLKIWHNKIKRNIYKCTSCSLLIVPEGVALNQNGISIYEEDDAFFLKNGRKNYYLDESNFLSCQYKLNIVKQHVVINTTALDIGANFGQFLKTASRDYNISGIEISPAAVQWSIQNFNVDNTILSIYDIPDNFKTKYDWISCWDVIEHLPDPIKAFKIITRCLKNKGYLFLTTPNSQSLMAKILGKSWYHIDVDQHLVLFNKNNITLLLENFGFEIKSLKSIGHHYKVQYIIDKLHEKYHNSLLKWPIKLIATLLIPFAKKHIYIKVGDVILIVAQKNITALTQRTP